MISSFAIIGAGNMGGAFAQGIDTHCLDVDVSLADRNQEKLDQFEGLSTCTDPNVIIANADAVMIAVKPQGFDDLCSQIGSLEGKLVISIMAGYSIDAIKQATGSDRVIRTMPNLGVQTGNGVTAWVASTECAEEDRSFIDDILSATGSAIPLSSEDQIDDFTVIAGCGPAYFFHLCDLLQKEAVERGFSPEDAAIMAGQTMISSAELLKDGSKNAADWVDAVASKGGVTEAALQKMAEDGLGDLLNNALDAGMERSRELG